jgi:tRNA nucleotidyltransferase (CCA-adding enzyme)
MPAAEPSRPLVLEGVPAAVAWAVDTLEAAGHEAWLVGGCVRDWLRGREPVDYDIATSAAPEQVLALFPRAVPTGLRFGTVMLPLPIGPIDVSSYRAGPSLEADLAHRDFTLNALAYHPRRRVLVDPHGGCADLEKGRLRAVGDPEACFAADPLRALRAARLHATLGLEVAPEVERAMAGAATALARVARERVRHELATLLLAPGAGSGLALLRRSGLEASLAPRAASDAPAVVPALPNDLELRLAAWLRGARAVAILRELRFSRRTVARVERLLRDHPVESGVSPGRDASVRRLLKRVGEGEIGALLALRRAELGVGEAAASPDAAAARERLGRLEQAVARVRRQGSLALRRQQLAIDGREVMQLLGRGPGPSVGRALAFLTDCVIEDPDLNTRERLRALLAGWAQQEGGA